MIPIGRFEGIRTINTAGIAILVVEQTAVKRAYLG